jgi:hypothetical protein
MNTRIFNRWCIVLTILWLFANWPTTVGLGGFYTTAGFPLAFAWGIGGFQEFDATAFLVDFVGGVAVIVGLSWLCTWSRRNSDKPTNARSSLSGAEEMSEMK